MSVLFAGDNRLLEWIEPLVSSTLVGSEEEEDEGNVEMVQDDHSKSRTIKTSMQNDTAKMVQVVSIGRPESQDGFDNDDDKDNDVDLDKGNGNNNNNTSQNKFKQRNVQKQQQQQRQQKQLLRNVPTSLLISDGQTTILAILSTETRKSLHRLATDDSVSAFQNNTISRGCVITISSWKLDTLVSSPSSEISDVNMDGFYVDRMQLLKEDPLLREHRTLLHHRHNNSYHSTGISSILLPEFTVVLSIIGPIKVIGAHGLAVVGRPTYIMDTVDVRRAVQSLSMEEFYSRIIANSDDKIRPSLRDSLTKKRKIVASQREQDCDDMYRTKRMAPNLEHQMNDDLSGVTVDHPRTVVRRVTMNSLEVLTTTASGLDTGSNAIKQNQGASSRGQMTANDDGLPIGNVEELLFGLQRTVNLQMIDDIWNRNTVGCGTSIAADASFATRTDNSDLPPNRKNFVLQKLQPSGLSTTTNNGNLIDESVSSKYAYETSNTNTTIGRSNEHQDELELDSAGFPLRRRRPIQKSVSMDCLSQIEEVMSDDYSSSDEDSVTIDDQGGELGISNMLMSEEDEDEDEEEKSESNNESNVGKNQRKNTVGNVSDGSIQVELESRSLTNLKNNNDNDQDVEKSGGEFNEAPAVYEGEPLECQPIHPVLIENSNVSNRRIPDVCDDDISIDDDETCCEDFLPLVQTQDAVVPVPCEDDAESRKHDDRNDQRSPDLLLRSPLQGLIEDQAAVFVHQVTSDLLSDSPVLPNDKRTSNHQRLDEIVEAGSNEDQFHDAVQYSDEIDRSGRSIENEESSSDVLEVEPLQLQTQEYNFESTATSSSTTTNVVENGDILSGAHDHFHDPNKGRDPSSSYSYEVATFERWMRILTSTMKNYVDESSSVSISASPSSSSSGNAAQQERLMEPLTLDEGFHLLSGDNIRSFLKRNNNNQD